MAQRNKNSWRPQTTKLLLLYNHQVNLCCEYGYAPLW